MEPVPGTGEPVDPEELRYAPRAPRRFTWLRRVVVLLVLLGLLSFGSMAAYGWTQKQYYVAVSDSKVAIFRGIQADLPGLTLSRLHSTSRVTLESLPEYRAEQVRDGISADDLEDARRIVANINELARVCPTPSPSPSPSPSAEPTGKGDREPTRRPSGGASDEPTASPTDRSTAGASQAPEPSPSASPSPTLAPPDCVEATP